MKNKYDYLIKRLLVLNALPLVGIVILAYSNHCTAIDLKFYSILLSVSFILIAGLLWFTLSNKHKNEKEEIQHKNRIKEIIISTYCNKIEKVDWSSDKEDKIIKNLKIILDFLYK